MSGGSPTRREALVLLATAVAAGAAGYGWFSAVGPAPEDERDQRDEERDQRDQERDEQREDDRGDEDRGPRYDGSRAGEDRRRR